MAVGVAIGATVIGAGASIQAQQEQKKAAKTSRKELRRAAELTNAREALQRQRSVRQRLERLRIENARRQSAAVSLGAEDSSALAGATASSTTTAATDIGFTGSIGGANVGIAAAQERSAEALTTGARKASTFQTISSASSLFSNPQVNTALGF